MKVVKLSAITSTNDYLKSYLSNHPDFQTVAVWAADQTKGRGQGGNVWISEPFKNLTFSVLHAISDLSSQDIFQLNILASVVLAQFLEKLDIPNVKVKWPNDIMADNKKIAGVLIENQVQGTHLKSAIIGIGLNVNQTEFGNFKRATSIKLLLGQDHDLESMLLELLQNIEDALKSWNTIQNSFYDYYSQNLFGLNKIQTFESGNEETLEATIKGVKITGDLMLVDQHDRALELPKGVWRMKW